MVNVILEPLFFVDTNVFLRAAQCHVRDKLYLCEKSRAFLDESASRCYVSNLVYIEVDHQLRTNASEYKGAKRVRRYVASCSVLPEESRADLIAALADAYVNDGTPQGWQGGTHDNDRLHAAIASAFSIRYLVTWDQAFISKETHIRAVNEHFGLKRLRFTPP